MKLILSLFISAIFIGAFSGPEIHNSGSMADLSHGSKNLGLVRFLTAAAMFLVVVVQVLRKNLNFGRSTIGLMASGSAFFLSAGLSAFVYAGTATAVSLMYLSIGTGGVLGLLCTWSFFKRRHLSKPRKADA